MLTTRLAALMLLLSAPAYLTACGEEEPAKPDLTDEEDPDGTDEDPDGTDEDPDGTDEDPDGTDEDPDGTDEDPDGTDQDPPMTGKSDGGTKPPPNNKADATTPKPTTDGGTKPTTDGGTKPTPTPDTPEKPGECCDDGKCVCRGADPTDDTLNKPGPFKVAMYANGFPAGMNFPAATIYYPEDAEPPYSGIVMCPGFTAVQSAIADYGPFFASHGMVTMVIDTNNVLVEVTERSKALLQALDSLKGENSREGSPLKGKLSKDRYGLGGWSMGGGGTWIATGDHPELKTGFSIAGHHATAGGAAIASKVKVPTLLLAGQTDTPILGGAMQSQDAYKAIPESTPKLMYEMTGIGHFGINSPVMNKEAGYYSLAFEKTFLEGDERYRKFLLKKAANASDWMSNIE
jgi:dienelactone hydrolase